MFVIFKSGIVPPTFTLHSWSYCEPEWGQGLRTTRHKNTHVFHQYFEARSRSAGRKKMMSRCWPEQGDSNASFGLSTGQWIATLHGSEYWKALECLWAMRHAPFARDPAGSLNSGICIFSQHYIHMGVGNSENHLGIKGHECKHGTLDGVFLVLANKWSGHPEIFFLGYYTKQYWQDPSIQQTLHLILRTKSLMLETV